MTTSERFVLIGVIFLLGLGGLSIGCLISINMKLNRIEKVLEIEKQEKEKQDAIKSDQSSFV